MTKIQLNIEGVHCKSCKMIIEENLQELGAKEINVTVDEKKKTSFYESVSSFLNGINVNDMYPDTSGIRPKLQDSGEGFRDFIIKDETDRKMKGFINLVGIDSPGVTASIAIADMVKGLF